MKDIFSTAIARLTVVYVSVLAIVCLLFSGFIYQLASNEIDQASRRQVVGFRSLMGRFMIDQEASEILREQDATEARSRLKVRLVLANVAVISTGTVLAYVFAKKTLKPIEENVKAQERFTSDASHELRTPLAVMRSEIEVALRDKSLKLPEAKELLESNLEEVNSLHAMTESLLHLARNKEVGEKKCLDVARLIKDIVKKYDTLAKASNCTIETKLKSTKIYTNQEAVSQTVSILLDNAIRYSGKGSHIRVESKAVNNEYCISVIDDGVGMNADTLAYIFERFTRADKSRTNQNSHGGNGLGLSIAKQLVEAMDGSISASSIEGKGSEFRIRLPLSVKS